MATEEEGKKEVDLGKEGLSPEQLAQQQEKAAIEERAGDALTGVENEDQSSTEVEKGEKSKGDKLVEYHRLVSDLQSRLESGLNSLESALYDDQSDHDHKQFAGMKDNRQKSIEGLENLRAIFGNMALDNGKTDDHLADSIK